MCRANNPSRVPDNSSGTPAAPPPLAGVFVVNKPRGISSMRVVAEVRRRAGRAKTGHAGTLDPLATGVLVLALGKATKIIDRLMATDKRYRTVIDLSAFTSTDDLEGERDEIAVASPPDVEAIREAATRFVGTIQQRPPQYSAVKVKGRRAYKAARQGEGSRPAPRPVTIHALELVRYEWPELELDIHCAKGAYIRSIARDLGDVLGTGGHCVRIHRTMVGPFTIDQTCSFDELPERIEQRHLIPPVEAIAMVERKSKSA